MAKPLNYYAGYPNQQQTPKWVGVAIGSIFAALTLVMVGVGIHIAFPASAVQASVAAGPETETPVAATPAVGAPMVAAAENDAVTADEARPAKAGRASRHHGKTKKAGHGAVRLAAHKPARSSKKVQLFAKSASGSRRDKRARDDLDKMLGL
jgi:hypothetical protein